MNRDLPYPLDDIRVLDLSRVLSGPFVGRILADLGADVLKVEPPEGDVSRFWGRGDDGLSGFFIQQNVGKRCITVDLKAGRATELILQLVKRSDVVIENFRPGVLSRLGLDYDHLAAVNSAIVLLSITGFGQSGPLAQRPAYAPVIHAESGLMSRQAHFDDAPISDLMLAIGDTLAGLHGLVGIFAALHLRDRTGAGQHVDIAMLDSMLATDDYAHHALDKSPIRRLRSDVWDSRTGPILLAGEFRWIWRQLSTVHGLIDGIAEGADLDVKIQSRRAAVASWVTSFQSRAELVAALEVAQIASASVEDFMSVFDTDHARDRGCYSELPGDQSTPARRVVQTPYRFSAAASGARDFAARQGEHNVSALVDWLGVSPDDIAELTTSGVVVPPTN
jgi:CoA:oxalate CoA-transferase